MNSHYTRLINMKPAMSTTVSTTKGLGALCDNFERHFRSLEMMQKDTNQDVFVSMMISKIPKDVLLHLHIQKGPKENWKDRGRYLIIIFVPGRWLIS